MIDIKRFRADTNIKQREICELLNIAQPYLSAIERGERPFSKEKLSVLHKHYGDIILNYKNADIIIEHKKAEVPLILDNDERSRLLTIIENQQKSIEHQQSTYEELQKMLYTQQSENHKEIKELSRLVGKLEAELVAAKKISSNTRVTSDAEGATCAGAAG